MSDFLGPVEPTAGTHVEDHNAERAAIMEHRSRLDHITDLVDGHTESLGTLNANYYSVSRRVSGLSGETIQNRVQARRLNKRLDHLTWACLVLAATQIGTIAAVVVG